jgi:hypothetical protein
VSRPCIRPEAVETLRASAQELVTGLEGASPDGEQLVFALREMLAYAESQRCSAVRALLDRWRVTLRGDDFDPTLSRAASALADALQADTLYAYERERSEIVIAANVRPVRS